MAAPRRLRLDDLASEAHQRHRLGRQPLAALDRVHEADDAGAAVVAFDVDAVDIEDLGDLVTDKVVHCLPLESLGKALLDAVDDRQFGGARVRLAEEPLRLVEEASIFESDAEAAGEGHEEPDIRLGERVLTVEVLQ